MQGSVLTARLRQLVCLSVCLSQLPSPLFLSNLEASAGGSQRNGFTLVIILCGIEGFPRHEPWSEDREADVYSGPGLGLF